MISDVKQQLSQLVPGWRTTSSYHTTMVTQPGHWFSWWVGVTNLHWPGVLDTDCDQILYLLTPHPVQCVTGEALIASHETSGHLSPPPLPCIHFVYLPYQCAGLMSTCGLTSCQLTRQVWQTRWLVCQVSGRLRHMWPVNALVSILHRDCICC